MNPWRIVLKCVFATATVMGLGVVTEMTPKPATAGASTYERAFTLACLCFVGSAVGLACSKESEPVK
jgi:hypothetical protein